MTYRSAARLHNEDEVILKAGNVSLHVIETEVKRKTVLILFDDGNIYHHTEVK